MRVHRSALPSLLLLLLAGCTASAPPEAPEDRAGGKPSTLEQNFPLTASNLQGHKALYNEGWGIITSTRGALDYAYQHSVVSAGEAMTDARQTVSARTPQYGQDVAAGVASGVATAGTIHRTGGAVSGNVTDATRRAAARQRDYGAKLLGQSWDFVTGGIYYGPRTSEHWQALKTTWGDYYGNLQQDFSNVEDVNARIRTALTPKIEADWDGAWREATVEFDRRYQASGEASNSFTALGDIMAGYWRSFWVGVAKPTGRTVVLGGTAGARGATYVFTPVVDGVFVSGRTVQASGLSVYYAGRTTVDIMAPTVEAGFLTGLGLLSLGSSAATYVGGETVGLVNQVAFTGAGALAGGAEAGAKTALNTGKYVALVTYDVGKGGTRVLINQAQSGVVLGYNALTALPAQTLLAIPNAAVFLAFEGPKLVIVKATGAIKGKDGTEATPADLPVGTVVDLKKLQAQPGVQVETVTDDPAVTQDVLQRMQDDLKTP